MNDTMHFEIMLNHLETMATRAARAEHRVDELENKLDTVNHELWQANRQIENLKADFAARPTLHTADPVLIDELLRAALGFNRIGMIKAVRMLLSEGLKESKDRIEAAGWTGEARRKHVSLYGDDC